MKTYISAAIITLGALSAQAWMFDKKYSSYPDPDNIQRLTLKLSEKGSLTATGVVVGDKFRLEDISGQSADVFTISSPKIRSMGLDHFLADCERNRQYEIFELAHDKNNVFILEGEVLPLNKIKLASLIAPLKDETIYTDYSIDTPLDDSLIGPYAKSARLTARMIRRQIDPQIQSQKDEIWETGKIKLDLTGKDAFVCDLLTKKTTLIMGTRMGFAQALPDRVSAITPQQLKYVVEKMESKTIPVKSARDGIALNAIIQNEAMKEVMNKDFFSFDTAKFMKISNSLVSSETGALSVSSSDQSQIKKIARSLDETKYLKQLSNVMVYPDLQVK